MEIAKTRINHMVSVAEYMLGRASAYGLDGEEMYVLGLLHDIGYLDGAGNHEDRGMEILSPLLKNERFLFAIANHGKSLAQIEMETKGNGIFPEFVLLVEADMSIDFEGNCVGFCERLDDITKRHGVDSLEAKNAKGNVEFVEKYCRTHKIS